MRSMIGTLVLCLIMAANLFAGGEFIEGTAVQQPIAKVDVKKVQRFCDVGFRFTANGINFDIEKLLGLGLHIDPKVLQAVSSQAAVQVTVLTHLCRMAAAGLITPEVFVEETRNILQYAKDLETVRAKAEEATKTPISEKPDQRLDPGQVARAELDLAVESSIDVGGELHVVLRRLAQRYACLCRPERR